jgi:hypothetical protein
MTLAKLTNYTLYISFVLYVSLLLPQVFYNLKRRSVDGLSWGMHLLLITSYIFDIGFSVGTLMPWQYYAIPMTEVPILMVQHVQFKVYRREYQPRGYVIITISLLLLAITMIALLSRRAQYAYLFPLFGFVSLTGWSIANIPQIILNFRSRSTEGLVVSYAFVSCIAHSSDIISAYGLNWGIPIKIGSPFAFLLGLILISQYYYYRQPSSNMSTSSK